MALIVSTCRYDEFLCAQELLTMRAQSGELTVELLDEAMRSQFGMRDYLAESIGFEWLKRNPRLFGEAAKRLGLNIGAFLVRHGQGKHYSVGQHLLAYPEVLQLVPEPDRKEFIRQVYLRHGAIDNSWLSVVTQFGPLSGSVVARFVLEKVETAECSGDRGGAETIRMFLDGHGCYVPGEIYWSELPDWEFADLMGNIALRRPRSFPLGDRFVEERLGKRRFDELTAQVESKLMGAKASQDCGSWEPTQWAVLNDTQFAFAIGICAGKSPVHFFQKREHIEYRLGQDAFRTLGLKVVSLMGDKLTEAARKFMGEQIKTDATSG